MTEKKHVPVPKNTRAFICANCGAVALDANNICKVQGMGMKSDWCVLRGLNHQKPVITKLIVIDGNVEIVVKYL